MSSLDFEEAGHKLLKIRLEQGQEMELCVMVLECCTEEKTYRSFYVYRECFENLFVQQYSMVHRFETNKLISVATFFGHLLATDALPWHLLGIKLLNEKLHDPTMEETFESIFPKDHLKNTLFSINFFTKIGLGGITQKLRQFIAKRKETDSEESSGDDGTKRKRRRKRG
ncbi:hypothetical protein ARALYDRAFT_474352 [Arabidopsis lyrata subsp. lyrata]|uniref:MI domain-containing protein n=1 Tax=Arabidopsis lyrata subsp. lyrata TaxID=81972 RepID=D7KIR7_ARALL|nr:hypothetical protein ARALYDRAFT_474352 [Arabidopsis lyrata subsp. lyrata]